MSNHEIKAGDHLWIQRTGYQHHGIASSSTEVIHYVGKNGAFGDGLIEETDIWSFSEGNDIYMEPHVGRRHNRARSVARARSRLGEEKYNVVFNNCEHFVSWCIEGVHSSKQVNNMVETGGAMASSVDIFRAYATWKGLPSSTISTTEALIRNRWAMEPAIAAVEKLALGSKTTATLASALPAIASGTAVTSANAAASTIAVASLGSKALATVALANPVGLTVLTVSTSLYAVKKIWDYFTD
jgi:hypothetical protein